MHITSEIKNFFITNKKIISYFLIFILILIFIFFGYQSYSKSKIKNISDEYNSAIIEYSQNNKGKTTDILVNIVNKKNIFLQYMSQSLLLSLMGFIPAAIAASSTIYFFPMWILFGLSISVINLGENKPIELS